MSEVTEKRDELLSTAQQGAQEQRRRLAEIRAREHIGAAGWEQASLLERTIRLGREGLAATDALRQVVHLTAEQLRHLPLGAGEEQREEHRVALGEILRTGEQQVTVAQALNDLLARAMEQVTAIPVDDVSGGRLSAIHARVQEQLAALDTIITAAQAQADTLEQLGSLERVTAEHQERVQGIRQLSAEEELLVLGESGEQVVERIAELDGAHAQQVAALTRIGEAIVERLPATGADAQAQAEALEHLAQTAAEKADALRG